MAVEPATTDGVPVDPACIVGAGTDATAVTTVAAIATDSLTVTDAMAAVAATADGVAVEPACTVGAGIAAVPVTVDGVAAVSAGASNTSSQSGPPRELFPVGE